MTENKRQDSAARFECSAAANQIEIRLGGDWLLHRSFPDPGEILTAIQANPTASLVLADDQLGHWDTALLTFLKRIIDDGQGGARQFDATRLPGGVQALLDLAYAVGERAGARREANRESFLAAVGRRSLDSFGRMREGVTFLGSASLALARFVTGRARFQGSEFLLIIQDVGARAFGIVSLISFLVGMILAFVGAVQLSQFGAGIYVANLVGLAMAREMGAMMTAIIMAGRTGAAFAAQLGTMRVNEEIDALSSMGIDPMEFLVVPRMMALMLMMPLLVLYADLMGILGGMVVGVGMLDLGVFEYIEQTRRSVSLTQVNIGLVKGVVFGVLVAVAGCLRGMQCGNSSQAVGMAATSAVVTSIVLIIVTDGLFAVVLNVLGM
ncbi:MAG: ABC transporter permease [Gammaproteobacteria bacterium]|nr:MAG: ABC transporter permease [Gammaproteobacteria bacterium]